MKSMQKGMWLRHMHEAAGKRKLAIAVCSVLLVAAGCSKKKVTPPPPPPPAEAPPPAAKPVIEYFNAEPSTISSGQPSSLRWSVSNASSVTIDNSVGSVSPSGRRAVYPTGTTTYHLIATGPAGESSADATITVATPPPPVAATNNNSSIQDILAHQVQDIHFDYDRSEVRAADQGVLQGDASALKQIFSMDSNFVVTIEGHCDERGSGEYNLALGDRRAAATRDALVALGVPSDKLKTISFGKERPLCTDASEACYARNRRAHFSAAQ
jgi:peptidoglycan-associated lipoprotein